MLYINEPLTQHMPMFYNFMGGMDFLRSTQALSKLSAKPRHWKGTRIHVTDAPSEYTTTDGHYWECQHMSTEIERFDNDNYNTLVCMTCDKQSPDGEEWL